MPLAGNTALTGLPDVAPSRAGKRQSGSRRNAG